MARSWRRFAGACALAAAAAAVAPLTLPTPRPSFNERDITDKPWHAIYRRVLGTAAIHLPRPRRRGPAAARAALAGGPGSAAVGAQLARRLHALGGA